MYRAAMTMVATGLLASGALQAQSIKVEGQLISTTTGEPPLVVSSGEVVPELNADRLDGFDVGDFATAGSGAGVHYKNLVGIPGEEIDQDCAVNTGCFGGDPAGFPVEITEPGSYRLAGNLDISALADAENLDVIQIQSSNVHLDLNGFRLLGPVDCTGNPVSSCGPEGTGRGIVAFSFVFNTVIRNGQIRGMGEHGIQCQVACRIVGVRVMENASNGIVGGGIIQNVDAVSNGSVGVNGNSIYGSVSRNNGSNGMSGSGTFRDNLASGNAGHGIHTFAGAIVVNNTVNGNVVDGIDGDANCVVADNTARGNGASGFDVESGTRVSGNTARDNSVHGFECFNCLLVDNVSSSNDDHGVEFFGSDSAYGGNLIFDNPGGTVDGTAISQGGNVCNGALGCP